MMIELNKLFSFFLKEIENMFSARGSFREPVASCRYSISCSLKLPHESCFYIAIQTQYNSVHMVINRNVVKWTVTLLYFSTLFSFNLLMQSKIFKVLLGMFEAAISDSPPKTLLHCSQVCIWTLGFIICTWGRSMVEWLGRRTWNSEVAGLSPALTTMLELFLGGP